MWHVAPYRPDERRRRVHGLAPALALLLALATGARADEPTLREVRSNGAAVTEVTRGAIVTVVGDGLHACPPLPERAPGEPPPRSTCRHEDLVVRLGGYKVLIVDATRERITFIVPTEVFVGRRTLTVELRDRGRASLAVEVVPAAPAAWLRLDASRFTVDAFQLRRDARGAAFTATGHTGGLHGASLELALRLDDRTLDARTLETHQDSFEATFGPYDRPLPAGRYTLTVTFELERQSRVWRRSVIRATDDREALTPFERLTRQSSLTLGEPDDAERERAALRSDWLSAADEVERLLGELDRWRAEAHVSRLRLPLRVAPPRFDRVAFERWCAERLSPAVVRVVQDDQARDARFAFPLFPAAAARLARMRALLVGWTHDLATRARAHAPDVPGVEPAPGWTLRAGFDVERRGLDRALSVP